MSKEQAAVEEGHRAHFAGGALVESEQVRPAVFVGEGPAFSPRLVAHVVGGKEREESPFYGHERSGSVRGYLSGNGGRLGDTDPWS